MGWFWNSTPKLTQAEWDALPELDLDYVEPVAPLKRTPAPDTKDVNVMMAWARTQPPMYDDRYPKWDARRYHLGAPTGPVWAYIQAHHYTEHEEVHLGVLLMDGETQAEAELAMYAQLNPGFTISDNDRKKVVSMRSAQIMWMNAEAEDLQELEFQRMMAENDRNRALMDSLREIKASIDRGAVAANAIDFAKRHPVLAALFGETVIHGVKNIIR